MQRRAAALELSRCLEQGWAVVFSWLFHVVNMSWSPFARKRVDVAGYVGRRLLHVFERRSEVCMRQYSLTSSLSSVAKVKVHPATTEAYLLVF